jgi:mannose-1-phosphate guanylyltransferase
MLHAVIMAGGSGTRFWPASRAALPKQLLDLAGDRTMIQATFDRLRGLVPNENILVLTNERLVEVIRKQLDQLPPESIMGEPCRRDTAPCIGLAAAWISRRDPDATMVVMPSDHVIPDVSSFQTAVGFAEDLVDEDPRRLVTFGIRPTYPAESFGYIERGELLATGASGQTAFRVRQFREKPKADVARQYLASGRFDWNSGIFVWRARTILDSLQRFEPQMYRHIQAIAEQMGSHRFHDVLAREFANIVGKSIDFAVMEKETEVVTIEAPFSWDDVGSWQALARLRGTDPNGNTIVGRYLGINTSGSIVRSDEHHLIVTIGLRDCLVVHTPDATLVANKHDEESVREIVKKLDEQGWHEYL